ncbi:MAG: hypothetical protein ACI9FU_001597 [Granulosicoccus sp.]|jgi:hypothetical protein
MKKLTILVFLIISVSAVAQNSVVVTEGEELVAGATNNSMSITIFNGNKEDVDKAWKKQLKNLKGKITAKDELFADNCKLEAMGANTFDLYSITSQQEGTGCKLTAAVDLGGAYLNSSDHADQFKAMRDFIYQFGVDQNKAVIQEEIDEYESVLQSLQKEFTSLEKDDQKLDEEIAEHQDDIRKSQLAKTENLNVRKTKSDAIIALEKISSGDGSLDKLKDERKALEKEGKKLDSSVDSSKKKIKKVEEEKVENMKLREAKSSEVSTHQDIVDEAMGRKEAVK